MYEDECPSVNAIAAHIEAGVPGGADSGARRDLEEHVEECVSCSADYSLVRGLRRMGLDPGLACTRENSPVFLVFMDESGAETKSYEPRSRRTLGLASVITTAAGARDLERIRHRVVRQFRLPEGTEIHANPCLLGQDEFADLSTSSRESLLATFLRDAADHYLFHFPAGMLKPLVPGKVQNDLGDRNLSQYGSAFLMTVFVVGNYLDRALGARFRFIYDESDVHTQANLNRILNALRQQDPDASHCRSFIGGPRPLDSKACAAIQLADVIAHYNDRHHQLYYGKFDHDERLEPFRERIAETYDEFLRPKELPIFCRQLRDADWDVLSSLVVQES